ncbi:MAG: aldehyde dehydrogenase family protein [Polyangiaceae bacterium]|nr:aldehyde dehydrogenase family protein [Polyangiaceae bacterium]
MDTRDQPGSPPTLLAPNWIGGRVEPPTSASFTRNNPALRDDVVTLAPLSGRDTVTQACRAAREAQPRWARVPAPQRALVLGHLARLLRSQKEAIARFIAREVGKPVREARGSVQEAIDTAEFFLGEGRRLYGQTVPSELPEKELMTHRRPVGVVGVVTPGNFPLAVPSWKLIPAVLCGNTVVWKPSEDAPGTAALLTELFALAGLPPGVLNVVHGGGANGAGAELLARISDGGIDKVSFTGSTAVGRLVGELCGRALTVPSLELGGKNPLVILADADLEAAVDGAVWGAFASAGQRCTSVGNVVVDRRVLPLVREQLVHRARALVIGDPRREDVDYGPLIHERFLQRFIEQRGIGNEAGAELLLDGRRITANEAPAGFVGDAAQGLYVSPRVFDRVKPTMRIALEECFGPTVNLIEVAGLDEAIAAATASPYALSAAIYTRDARAMLRFREEVGAGLISVNNSTIGAESQLPFGGNGWSGNGTRECGIWVLDAYTRWQAVNMDFSGRLQRAQIDVPNERTVTVPDFGALGG